jgi:hypothetical protein
VSEDAYATFSGAYVVAGARRREQSNGSSAPGAGSGTYAQSTPDVTAFRSSEGATIR